MPVDIHSIFDKPSFLENWFSYLPGLAYRCNNDTNWTMMFVSEGSTDLTGYFPGEFTRQEVFFDSLILPEFREYVWKEIQNNLDKREPFTLEYKILTRSGEIRWVWEKGSGIFNDEGKLLFLEGFITDITKQKQSELEIVKSENLLKTLLNAITESSFLIEPDGTVVIANEIAARRMNTPLSDLIGKNALDFLDKDVADNRKTMMNQVTRTKQPVVFEDERFGRTILNSIYPVFDEKGEVCRYAVFGYDVTERKNIERKEEYSSSLFSVVFDSSPDAIFLVEPVSNLIIKANYKALQLFEIPEGTDLSTTRGTTFHKYPFSKDEIFDMEQILNEKGRWSSEIEYVTVKGREFWGEIVINQFNFREEKYLLVRVNDISERIEKVSMLQSMAAELRENNDQKDKFISILAHDLRGPFHPLLSALELLDSEYDSLTEEEKRIFIKNSYETANTQYHLLESMLNWSRATHNNFSVKTEQLIMYQIIAASIQQVIPVADDKGITIKNESDKKFEVIADSEMTLTVLRNLLTNAIKFSQPGSNVIVSAKSIDGMIVTSVSDNGLGISPERLAKLFNISSAESTPGTKKEKGSGLGLLICKELVEKMGGNISVESEVNRGTTVSFTLPAVKN
ncbi:hypothetical protein MASR2M39_22830 [Ignavibacteriales bacterium]